VTTTPVLATLAYVLSPDGSRVLLMHRDKRPDDIHFGKYVGLGGRVEPDEDVVSGVRREIREEAGIEARELTLRGTILWPGFGKGGQDWFGFVFRVDTFDGEPHSGNAEGTLEWVDVDKLATVSMWASDHEWLPMVFDRDPRQFHGVMPYKHGEMVSWSFTRV
jgi:8-oxo-dGTP diphosphatase